jgi:hypothetical protein
MPKPTSKSRQELRSRFVRNAIPTETDFADLIAASLNQADDGVLKLPDQPLALVRQKPDQPVLRFFADPAAEGPVWQLQLGAGDKPGFGLAGADGKLALFVDGATGNVGIGIGAKKPEAALHVAGNLKVEAGSILLDKDQHVFFTDNGWVGSRDGYHQLLFRSTESILELREWGDLWFSAGANQETINKPKMVITARGLIGIGTKEPAPECKLNILEQVGTAAGPNTGTLLLDHENAGGASSIVFRSQANRGSDHAFIEFKDKNPLINDFEAALLTIGMQNNINDHIALMPSGNVGIGTTTPGAKLHVLGDLLVKGAVVRSIWAVSDNGPIEEGDMGRLNSRTIRINKLFPETALRIVYCDNFRVMGKTVACRWEIRVDGNSVNPPIIADRYEREGNKHIHGTVMGYAKGVTAGVHEIQVWIVAHPYNKGKEKETDASTGWSDSTWSIEAEEIWLA